MKTLITTLLVIWLTCAGTQCALGEFILDEFDDPVFVMNPVSNDYLETQNVGPLQATREVRIFSLEGDPISQLDADIANSSMLTGQVSRLNGDRQTSRPIVSMVFDYSFALTDFSEGGKNNAVLLDFSRVESEIPISQFLIGMGGLYYFHPYDIRSSSPFTMVVPFADFYDARGGSPETLNPENIVRLEFEIRVSELTGGGPDPLNFYMELDRIRVGQVPEPNAMALSILATLLISSNIRTRAAVCSSKWRTIRWLCENYFVYGWSSLPLMGLWGSRLLIWRRSAATLSLV